MPDKGRIFTDRVANQSVRKTLSTVLVVYFIACVASVPREFVEKVQGREQKKKKGMTGQGEGNEGNACPQTPSLLHSRF